MATLGKVVLKVRYKGDVKAYIYVDINHKWRYSLKYPHLCQANSTYVIVDLKSFSY